MSLMKTYSELIKLKTFEERFRYLQTASRVGDPTFGSDRYLNQSLYTSPEWAEVKNEIIIRDNACDLAMPGYEIRGKVILKDGREFKKAGIIIVHHINPLTKQDILNRDPKIFDPNNLICCSFKTHNAIHYGDLDSLPLPPRERTPHDTCPWR